VENSATGVFRESVQNQFVSWSEWQDLNLIQTIDIAQGGSDNRAQRPGKPRSRQAEILTGLFSPSFSQVLRMAASPICKNSAKSRGNERAYGNERKERVLGY
jgi:hypothetical protein